MSVCKQPSYSVEWIWKNHQIIIYTYILCLLSRSLNVTL